MSRAAMVTNRDWWWFPWAIVAAFVAIVAVNGALAYFAIHSSTGLVTEHPFELGNGYNAVLAAGAAQDKLGWRGAVQYSANGPGRGTIDVAMRDRAGNALPDLAVRGELVRPIEDLPPIQITLSPTGAGRYVAPIALPRLGQWQVRVYARRGQDSFVFAERIFVP